MRPSSSSSPPQNPLKNPLTKLFLLAILCSISYIFGSYKSTVVSPESKARNPETCSNHSADSARRSPPPPLDFATHHSFSLPPRNPPRKFETCAPNFTHYCPCQDPHREKQYAVGKMLHRERHCPASAGEVLRCLVPRPVGYKKPFPWPKSRTQAWFSNVPFKRLTESKKQQNWVRLEGDRLVFPGGGTSFPMGVKGYIDLLKKMVPLQSGAIRTALDTGCGVASFGATLMDYDILTMSIAPRDVHEAQVQFALERGVPAMLGVLSTYRLPYPARSFDMAHCSRCLVPWTEYDGLYLVEIDRVLRPGGYWVLSGPPINWRVNYKGWRRTTKDLENEQRKLADLAKGMCWRKVREKGPIAVWQKPSNHVHCIRKKKILKSPKFCTKDQDPDEGWYKKMEPCITPLPEVGQLQEVAGGSVEKWPERLTAVPPRVGGAGRREFLDDGVLWRRRVAGYPANMLKSLSSGGYRNIMDMNAGLGGFAASLAAYPVWVMNVVPHDDARNETLGVIYERGLIGTYMDWCEPFSTYPRSYDLIHADNVFSLYAKKCDILDIFVEMYRILRPQGTIIIGDHVDHVVKVKSHADQMGWHARLADTEAGPFGPRKLLFLDI